MKKQSNNIGSFKRKIARSAIAAGILMAYGAYASASVTAPVIGNLLWSEEFNGTTLNTSLWTAIDGNGCPNLCGNGNQELQWYSPNNVSIQSVPFEPATRALALKAQSQTVGSNVFTSGKVSSTGKVQVKYGMVEMRVSAPVVGTGLWPAAWMLGTSPQTWPRNGEIDIMEMGHSAAGRAGAGNPPINNFMGSNVITYQDAACVPGNASCAASTAWQTKNWYIPSVPFGNRFVTYRFYWTDTQMRFTVIDNGVERNLYDNPLPVNSTSLQSPFYLLFNLAVGGNFTDAASPGQVTAPLPGTMYVDYVRVYQLDGKGEVKVGNPNVPEVGKFGVFTDNTVVNNKLVAGTSSDIWNWNNASMSAGNTAPFEGSNVMAWNFTAPNQWFGSSVQARQIHDMSNYKASGTVKFKIKIPASVAFKVGIGDTYTNQGTVTFPANVATYGLVRDGNWGTATIPVSALAGNLIALQSMSDLFQIFSVDGSLPTTNFQWAVDDIVWDTGVAVSTTTTTTKATTTTTSPTTTSTTKATTTTTKAATTTTKATTTTTKATTTTTVPGIYGVTQTNATTVQFSVKTSSWADVHFTVNSGLQQNFRMVQASGNNTYSASGLKLGDVVTYSFTYWDVAHNFAVDTAQQSYTMK